MTKYEALVNAQSVYAWAVLFGHGSLHQLIDWSCEIELTVHFKYGEFVRDREDQKYRSVVMAGAEFEWTDRPDLQIEVLAIKWHYTK